MSEKLVCVIGAGTMGNGIAHVFAASGFKVNLFDLSPTSLQKGMDRIAANLERQVTKEKISRTEKDQALALITLSTDLKSACKDAHICIEAVSESLKVKGKLFEQLSQFTPKGCILASNTSSISIEKISKFTKEPGKVIGMHFMNPVPIMPLVEVIKSPKTEPAVYQEVLKVIAFLGKTPVLANDAPGFVANRILMPMINEAIFALNEGVADVDAIDQVMKLGMAHPMGPLELADYIGLDVCLSIIDELHSGFDSNKYEACSLLKTLVHKGELGVKTKKGFYEYMDSKEKKPRVFNS